MAESKDGAITPPQNLAVARLSAGFVQGFTLYLLYSAADAKVWPATDSKTFASLLFVALATPLAFTLGVGNLRRRTLILWLAGATTLVAFLAWYGIWRQWPFEWSSKAAAPNLLPDFSLFVGTCAMLFIGHALIAGGDHDRRFRASYPTHFDVSWKLGVQLALASVFVGIFWGLLWLGAGLFDLVKLHFFQQLIEHRWFAIPVTALAAAAALHITDVRPALVRGTRTLVLVLLSWLLPLLAGIVVAFLVALFFTGLSPLWQTRRAAALLLTAAAVLIFLINATYQDGDEQRVVSRPFRYAGSAAALALMPLTALAAYALLLRVEQYGWTVDRVTSAAFVIVGLAYAGGYAFAVFCKGPWVHFLEACNFAVALFVLAVLFVYFSPIADPARISVGSQMARLAAGKIEPTKFDFNYLRWHGERFGKEALDRLKHWSGDDAAIVHARATDAASGKGRWANLLPTVSASDISKSVSVYPRGRELPAGFIRQIISTRINYILPVCLREAWAKCDAFLIDLDGDGREEIVIVTGDAIGNVVYAEQKDGLWKPSGTLNSRVRCGSLRQALREGKFSIEPPEPPRYRDIVIGTTRLSIEAQTDDACLDVKRHR